MVFQLVTPRADESLYSMRARVQSLLGVPASRLERAFGWKGAAQFDMPSGLAACEFGDPTVVPSSIETVATGFTLLPYYGAFAARERWEAALQAMAAGDWVHSTLGSWNASAPPPEQLRFCASCLREMLDCAPTAWWKRSHQLPSSLVCTRHAEPLRLSLVDGARRRRDGYVAASLKNCPASASAVSPVFNGPLEDLVWLASEGEGLLAPGPVDGARQARDEYLAMIRHLSLVDRRGGPSIPRIAESVQCRWGATLGLWPDLSQGEACRQKWLYALLLADEDRSPPLHHLLLRGALMGFAQAEACREAIGGSAGKNPVERCSIASQQLA